jgi:hypothetical protein
MRAWRKHAMAPHALMAQWATPHPHRETRDKRKHNRATAQLQSLLRGERGNATYKIYR